MEKAGGLPVHLIDATPFERHGIVRAVQRHHDACPVAKEAHGLHIVEVFDAADEVDHLAARPAAEAIVALVFGIDGERGRFFVMERAQPDQILAAPPQLDVAGNDLLDVAAGTQLLQEFVAEPRQRKHPLAKGFCFC